MNKFNLLIILMGVLLASCAASYHEGALKDSYNPLPINGAKVGESALIKGEAGLRIWKVDGERKVSAFKLMAGGGLDSILIKEGEHTLSCSIGYDVNIGPVYYKKGHEYVIEYIEKIDRNRKSLYYWVKDITDNKVVYGKERSKEELMG